MADCQSTPLGMLGWRTALTGTFQGQDLVYTYHEARKLMTGRSAAPGDFLTRDHIFPTLEFLGL